MRNLLTILLTLFLVVGCSSQKSGRIPAEVEELLTRIDTTSFDDLKLEIKESASQLESMSGIIELIYMDSGEPKFIDEEDVRTENEKRFDLPLLNDSLLSELSFNQSIYHKYSNVNLSVRDLHMPDWCEIDVWLDALYFADGTVDTSSVYLDKMEYVKTMKRIDTIKTTLRVSYPVDVEKITLTVDDSKVLMDSVEVRLNAIQDNMAEIVMSRKISGRYLAMQAVDSEGRFVSSFSSKQGGFPADVEMKFWSSFVKILTELSENIDKDKYKNKEELKAALIKYSSELPYERSPEFSVKKYFNGNVDKVIVYYAGKVESQNYNLTLATNHSTDEKYVLLSDDNNKYGLLDVISGRFIVEPSFPALTQLNDYYYTYSDYYNDYLYRFDEELLQMIEVKGYEVRDIWMLNEDLLIVADNDYKGVLDKRGKLVIPMQYDEIGIDRDNSDQLYLVDDDGNHEVRDIKTLK